MPGKKNLEKAYAAAKERYAEFGVDTDAVLKKLQTIPVSIQCWQGDDVMGFEEQNGGASAKTGGGRRFSVSFRAGFV